MHAEKLRGGAPVWLALVLATFALFAQSAQAADFKTVIIDPGHGGHDRGAGIGYTYEKHLAFDVSRRLEKVLNKQGIKTVMTRNRDEFISLTRRVAVANKYKGSVFVSVHFNSSSSSQASGLETYYSHNQSKSRVLAQLIQSAAIFKTGFRNRGAKNARYHVLSNNSRPAVLVECGFLTNSSERARSLSPTYRQKLAEGIAMGLIRYKNAR